MYKLKVGDLIRVYGWCMLEKLEAGKYRVYKIDFKYGQAIYSFIKPKGKKIVVRHYASSVDPWINKCDDLNKIEIL